MITLRPSDLAQEHSLSTQAVRNYERDGFIPPAERTGSGYRIYTEMHRNALRTYLALVPAFGHTAGGQIMNAVHRGDLDAALRILDRGHVQSVHDRQTLDTVRKAVDHLVAESDSDSGATDSMTVGELAGRLRVTSATLRNWEAVGILTPARDVATGYRVYRAVDIRDAELAHLLRRGHYPLESIADVVRQIRSAGSTDSLARALDGWQRSVTARGVAMLFAAGELSRYLSARE
ncbi:TioE family transcriptional regulator [Antrihabitans cavernicola]|uniref:MerR family DNA-binding transcriptional regulator n=1 Tax=Antrihabitans cavernicola TaxID=2495913 RepID=A0A5A7SF96_9NOCA|nr:TioE family transcriptional regulator [Spelaeibacter cavernicola]KAA0024506.1 MerR family DNA-binding transcriptional regulator [Spelaeibacter cavernicola]